MNEQVPDTIVLLDRAREGDPTALDELFDHLYEALRASAHRALLAKRPGDTLRTTELVHEAYLKLVGSSSLDARNRAHFLAIAARAMRQVIVTHFRSKSALKRGGDMHRVDLEASEIPVDDRGTVILALDEALNRLAELNDRMSRVVVYRFFGGLTQDEIAATLNVTSRTVQRDWQAAKAYLARELGS